MTDPNVIDYIKQLERRLETLERYSGGGGGISPTNTPENDQILQYESSTNSWNSRDIIDTKVFGEM